MLLPHTTPLVWPEIAPDRYARRIACAPGEPGPAVRAVLVGLPDDTGVKLNAGRPGARWGPAAVRAALARFGTDYDAAHEAPLPGLLYDAGDIIPAPMPRESSERHALEAALHETHRRVTEALAAVHGRGLIPICIGGGHDLTFPAVRALAQSRAGPVGGVNVDAHLDVRETVGSGMPFRALIEGGHVDARRFGVLGAGRFANSADHARWLRGQGGRIDAHGSTWAAEGGPEPEWAARFAAMAASASAGGTPTFVSIDLDAIDASSAPGVSAVNPMGLSVRDVAEIARLAGADPAVRHIDVMELCPVHDEPSWDPGAQVAGRTARVAALLVLHIVAGLAERPS